MSTADAVVTALGAYGLRKTGSSPDRYRCNSPFRPGSDSLGFTLVVDDAEHGAYLDHARSGSEQGSLYQLAERMGIIPEGRIGVASTKRDYRGLADYAEAHGLPEAILTRLGWRETMHNSRRALSYPTANGVRYRFLDGQKPSYINQEGYKACWYRLDQAMKMATAGNFPLVICNGEVSTIAGQLQGVPACATTGGESRWPDELLAELTGKWNGAILIALDCDETGRKTACLRAAQLAGKQVSVIDLGLGDGGDLCDAAMLYERELMPRLLAEAERQQRSLAVAQAELGLVEVTASYKSSDQALQRFTERITHPEDRSLPLIMPFTVLHEFGGLCHVIPRGKVVGMVGVSGGLKTSAVESMIDMIRVIDPIHTLFWGPEWSWEEMADRSIQRMGGPSMTTISLHELWLNEERNGVPQERRRGRRMADSEVRAAVDTAGKIERWPGKVFYIDQMGLDVDQLLKASTEFVSDLSAQGFPITLAVWDYMQLLAEDYERIPYVMAKLKKFVVDHQLIGMVVTQVTKQASRENREDESKAISADDAQYLRTDTMNLVLTWKPLLAAPYRGGYRGIIGVGKNSGGKANVKKWVQVEPQHLKWLDRSAPGDEEEKPRGRTDDEDGEDD